MADLTGSNSTLGMKPASTFGTPSEAGTGDRLEVESLNQNLNPEELEANPIGSGGSMANDSQQGAISPSVDIEAIVKYNDPLVAALSIFMGGENTVNEGSGAFSHSLIDIGSWNTGWLSTAFKGHSGGVFEFPSCVVTKVQIVISDAPNYIRTSVSLLANDRVISGTTNTVSTLNATTVADTERAIVRPTDEFLINAQAGGALASPGDKKAFKTMTLELEKEQQFVKEVKGSAGNGEPVPTGTPPFKAKLTVELRSLADFTFFTAAAAGTEYKASFINTGSLIGGSKYKQMKFFLPRLKIIDDPGYNLQSAALNPHTVVFKSLEAASAPTGMFRTRPYFVFVNTRSANHNT